MLQWLLHRKELLTTFDLKRYNDVKDKLATANIPFRTNWNSPASAGRQRGALGSFGENPAYSTQYYIYVLDEDYDQAELALR